jgi:hypothetical protein
MAADSHIYFLANGVEDYHKLIYGYGCGYGRLVSADALRALETEEVEKG